MCSRYLKKQTVLMEKPKIKKTKTIQMKYPAPYSQSWAGPPAQRSAQSARKASTNRSSNQKLTSVNRRDTRPQLKCRGPDPAVPHLKYGLFPKKNRGQTQVVGSKLPLEADDTSEIKMPRVRIAKEGETSAPLFVVRSLDSRLTRRLSRAASTHLDIKPRNYK